MKDKVIAIDGPSGSGKSTVAKIVATKLKLTYLDTGSMFRAIGYMLVNDNIDYEKDDQLVKEYLNQLDFEYGLDENTLIKINGINLTEKIREHEVSKLASMVSKSNAVREYLKFIQRNIASKKPSVLEGRDIGSVIFPNAALKIYLTAESKVRAERRYKELCEKDSENQEKYSIKSIQKDIETRDYHDKNREIAPLVKADDAIEVNTSFISIEEVAERIISEYNKLDIKFN